jgi:hypothetical protein
MSALKVAFPMLEGLAGVFPNTLDINVLSKIADKE